MDSLKQIFTEAQRTIAVHPKLLKSLVMIYCKTDFNDFFGEFTRLLRMSLIFGDKQPSVDRTLSFVGKFATEKKSEKEKKDGDEATDEEIEEADPFLVELIQFLLSNHEANSQGVRSRVCQMINILLTNMGEEAVIDDELYNSIYDTMLHRLQDKVPSVRVQAVAAVARLQDPRNKECPVIKAYRYHLSMDPNPDVRRAVLANIAVTYQTLPDILERTRDVRDIVRRQAYEVISKRVHLKSLTIAQRVRLISEGLKDRSALVQSFVEKKLIEAWLKMVSGNVLDLLTCLDVEVSVTEAELAIKAIFKYVPYSNLLDSFGLDKDQRVVSTAELRPESALFWRCLAERLRKEGAEEALDTILPELTGFCQYVKDFVMAEVMDVEDEQDMALRLMEREFVIKELVSMTMLYDLADEVGRRSLDRLVRTLLVSDKVSEYLVKGLVEVFGKLHPPNARVTQLAEIISEVQEPVCKAVQRPLSEEEKRKRRLLVAHVKVKINQVKEELEECVRSRCLDIDRAKLLKEELKRLEDEAASINLDSDVSEEVVEEVRNDATTLTKCLMIICNMVESADVTVMSPTLHSLHENLVLSCLRSENPAVRNQAVRALGLFCLLSKDLAHQHITLFMQVSRIDVEQIQMTAVKFIIDMLHLYGLEEFTEAAEDMNTGNDELSASKNQTEEDEFEGEGGAIISALCQMMALESTDVRTVVAEGLCKLLLASRITSSKLLSHLILMWYNPATEDELLLRHMLGVFFPLYASYGGSNQESLCEAFLPTIHTLFKAPSRSPLAHVDVDDLANFLVSITSPAILIDKDKVNVHDALVFSLCTDILTYPESSWTKVLVKCLKHLQLSPTNYPNLRQVNVLALKILKRVKERPVLKAVEHFHHSIEALLKSAPEPEAESEVAPKEDTTDLAVEKAVENGNESCAGDSTVNKTLDNTVIRKKRMLFNTASASEVFSSEPESDIDSSPSKRMAHGPYSQHLENGSSDPGSPVFTSTQINKAKTPSSSPSQEKSAGSVPQAVIIPSSDSEIELTLKVAEDGSKGKSDRLGSADLFDSSQGSPVKSYQKSPEMSSQKSPEMSSQGSPEESSQESQAKSSQESPAQGHENLHLELTHTPTLRSSADEDDDSHSSLSSGRRRSKKESTTGQSSEEESTPPIKIPRKTGQTMKSLRENPRRTRSKSSASSTSDSMQLTTPDTPTDTSEGSISDFVSTRSSRSTRKQTQRVNLRNNSKAQNTRSSRGKSSLSSTTKSNGKEHLQSPQVQSFSSEDATPVRRSPRHIISSTSESDSTKDRLSSSSRGRTSSSTRRSNTRNKK